MANTGHIDGGDLLLYVEQENEYVMAGDAKSHSLSVTSEVRTRRTKQTGDFPGRVVTGLDSEVSTDCLALYDGFSYFDLLELQLSKTKVKLKLAGHNSTSMGLPESSGDRYIEGTFVIESIELNADNEDDARYSATFSIDGDSGPLEIKTVPAA